METYTLTLRMVDKSDAAGLLQVCSVLHSRRVRTQSFRYFADGEFAYVCARVSVTRVSSAVLQESLNRIVGVLAVAVR